MSHLPLDARAILHYLNELGYRNISAEQLKEFLKDLRKLIKFEERIGVNLLANGSYQSLCLQTTASFRAKCDQENVKPLQSQTKPVRCCYCGNKNKNDQIRDKVLDKYKRINPSEEPASIDFCKCPNKKVPKQPQGICGTLNLVEELVCDVLNNTFKSSPERAASAESVPLEKESEKNNVDFEKIRPFVLDMVVKILEDKFGQQENSNSSTALPKPVQTALECIVMKKIKEYLPEENQEMGNLPQDMQEKLKVSEKDDMNILSKKNFSDSNVLYERFAPPNKTLESEALMAELLADKKTAVPNTQGPSTSYRKPEWQQTSNDSGIKRMPYTLSKSTKWHQTQESSPKKKKDHVSPQSKRRSTGALVPTMVYKRKPMNTDPVALYQYYRKEWDHFAKQIPQSTKRSSERWHVREKFINIKK